MLYNEIRSGKQLLLCTLVAQLTSDKSRIEAHRFYTRLDFIESHEGFKLKL
ncbi:hypothetical protein Jab_1c21420 [Janthinobacterium sp. HH01]|nr:hypothetical protein Jab_1c21420 [Janthinobacterium sp. HH01]